MKFISWNVNGLRAIVGKGFKDSFLALDSDFVCLQETKLQPGQKGPEFPGYSSFWNYAEKKGYSGTAVYTKHDPLSVRYGIGVEEFDHEGRVITLEMQNFFLVNVYVPTSQAELRRLYYRLRWDDAFRKYLLCWKSLKDVIVCGDLNVAHEEMDLSYPFVNHLSAGFTDDERDKMTELLSSGFVDCWRQQHPGEKRYSWWPAANVRGMGTGWRLDYFLVSSELKDRILSTGILDSVFGSDHCPVELLMDF